jgi:hypothetical protein
MLISLIWIKNKGRLTPALYLKGYAMRKTDFNSKAVGGSIRRSIVIKKDAWIKLVNICREQDISNVHMVGLLVDKHLDEVNQDLINIQRAKKVLIDLREKIDISIFNLDGIID